ncbi:MAG: hypothetical protein SOV26_01250 [Candidatus Onthovivens sp.]|nr:hypothetical protein [Candidatus Onthovivens sp.]
MEIEYIYNKETDSYEVNKINDIDSKTILIPSNFNDKKVTKINSKALSNCISLEEILLPNTIECIDECAFYNNINLFTVYIYGLNINLDKLEIERGNSNFITSFILFFNESNVFSNIFHELLLKRNSISVESKEVFNFESIHYLRIMLKYYAYQEKLKLFWMYCDELDISEENHDCSIPKGYDVLVLDSYDYNNDKSINKYLNNIIEAATTNNILVIGLVREHNKNNVKFDDYKILNDFEIYDI